ILAPVNSSTNAIVPAIKRFRRTFNALSGRSPLKGAPRIFSAAAIFMLSHIDTVLFRKTNSFSEASAGGSAAIEYTHPQRPVWSRCVNKHEVSYRLLLSNPIIVRGLFQGIIDA